MLYLGWLGMWAILCSDAWHLLLSMFIFFFILRTSDIDTTTYISTRYST